MTDRSGLGGVIGVCDDKCGCTVPCPGGVACRCTKRSATASGGVDTDEHKTCSCGSHCGCNPCACGIRVVTPGVGKAHCKCAPGCSCVSCAT